MNVTICVPTLNAAAIWEEFWNALQAQTLRTVEVLILDSSSTDGTAELARLAGCHVITVRREDFRHGGTRQYAARLAENADVLVYMTQDAVLGDKEALARLTGVFEDASIGAAYGRQLPRPGSTLIAAHARLFNYPPTSATRSLDSVGTLGLKTIFFSNSFGAYRRRALLEVGGFPQAMNFGEDTATAARLLQAGYKTAYVAEACVYHSHRYSLRNEFRRYFEIGRLHGSEPWLLREFGGASHEGRRFVLSEIRYLIRRAPWRMPEAFVRTALKYWGYHLGIHATSRPSTSPGGPTVVAKEQLGQDERMKPEKEDYAAVGFRHRR